MAGILWFFILFLLYGWLKPTDNNNIISNTLCDVLSPLNLTTFKIMDLNGTFFINSIMITKVTTNYDSIDVDIGTTSCGSFDDKACYVTCSSRHFGPTSECLGTMNVTCDVDNVKGRYVRIRQNNAAGLVLCDVNITVWSDLNNKASKNFALNAPCTQSSTWGNWSTHRAGDGNTNGTMEGKSCNQTSDTNIEKIHWWQVNLGRLILVSDIVIDNRVDFCCNQTLANFTVELGRQESNGNITYTLCRYHHGVAGSLTTLNCTRSIWGQFVRISKEMEPLTLCEVEVYGDTYGNNTGHFTAMPFIPTDLTCDQLELRTSMTTPQITTAEAASTMLPTDATAYNMFSKDTSEAKVSTTNPQVSSEAKVSTETPQVSSEAKLSTETPQVSSEAKVSSVYSEAVTEAKQFTERSFTFKIPVEHNCMCSCWNAKSKKSPEEVQKQMLQTAKALKMKSSDLSQQIRKKSSLPDHRLSSAVMGIACGIAMAFIFGAIILSDICHLYHYSWTKKGEKGKKNKGKVVAELENCIHYENCQ